MTEPTRITVQGAQVWEDSDGRMHREDGPAIIYPNGTERWLYHGEIFTLPEFVQRLFGDAPEGTAFLLRWSE